MPFFGSNLNTTGAEIMTADVSIPSGPTVVTGDMGPIVNDFNYSPIVYTDSVYEGPNAFRTYGPITYNNVFNTDGTRELNKFEVTFDRPIDISTFTTGLIQVYFRDPESDPAVQVPVQSVTALDNQTALRSRGGWVRRVGHPVPDHPCDAPVPRRHLQLLRRLNAWTLASPITASATTLTVNAGGFIPPTGPFTVTLDKEQLTVTATPATPGRSHTARRERDGGGGAQRRRQHKHHPAQHRHPLQSRPASPSTTMPARRRTWTLASTFTAASTTLTVNAGEPTPPTGPFTITIGQEQLTVSATMPPPGRIVSRTARTRRQRRRTRPVQSSPGRCSAPS